VEYYQLLIDKMQPGAYIIADNTLWSGKVLDKPRHDDGQTIGILEFNKLVKNDDRVEEVILPLRDGMTVIRKK
jgi:predicted O-methyltransferase YrrM